MPTLLIPEESTDRVAFILLCALIHDILKRNNIHPVFREDVYEHATLGTRPKQMEYITPVIVSYDQHKNYNDVDIKTETRPFYNKFARTGWRKR